MEMYEVIHNAWLTMVAFLAHELFGPEIAAAYEKEQGFYGDDIREGEIDLKIELHDFEKRLWVLVEAAGEAVEAAKVHYRATIKDAETEKAMKPETDLTLRRAVVERALRNFFWAVVIFYHPEVYGKTFAIRRGFKVAHVANEDRPSPPGKMAAIPIPDEIMKKIVDGITGGGAVCVKKAPDDCFTCPMRPVCGRAPKETPQA